MKLMILFILYANDNTLNDLTNKYAMTQTRKQYLLIIHGIRLA